CVRGLCCRRSHPRVDCRVSTGVPARLASRRAGVRAGGWNFAAEPVSDALPALSSALAREVDRPRSRAAVDLQAARPGALGVAAQRASGAGPALLDYVSHAAEIGGDAPR